MARLAQKTTCSYFTMYMYQ